MAQTNNFTNFANEHPNYFPGQYLLEDDFELQHKYLSDRQRYYNQSFHISGIVEGLEVVAIEGKKSVQIKSGSAIDGNGELIVLKEDNPSFDLTNAPNGSGELYIQFSHEYKIESKQQEGVDASFTRWIEKPIIKFEAKTPENSVKLAILTISDNAISKVDSSIRVYSGISLPNSNNSDLTLRSGGNTNPNLAVLTGSLKIDGDLTVNGTISGTIDTKNITSGILSVDRIPNLSANKITSGTITGNLAVAGTISGKIDAGNITTGQLAPEQIPNLSATKITSGTITGNLTINGNIELLDYGKQIQLIKAVTAEGIIAWGTIQTDSYVGLQIGFPDGLFRGKLQIGTLSSTKEKIFNELMVVNANGNTSINGSLTLKGAIQPSAGKSENNGIMFPKDPGGGSGDAAWIQYYSRNPQSDILSQKEQMVLEIGLLNDFNDHIALMSSGNVGIGTITPAAKLDINGHIFEKLDVIQCGGRDDWGSVTHPIKLYFKNKLLGKPVGTMMRAIQDHPSWRGHYWQAWVDADQNIRVIHNSINTPHLADRNT